MGVLGLWEVLESVGHPIKVEGLEGKILGVDANIWLYKFIRGFREKDNATSIDSHKLGLFNRVCKLLYYRIKPVFVFDGPAPVLKRRTLERRQNTRNKQLTRAQDAALKILANQLKSQYPNADIDHLKISLPNLQSNNLVAAEKLTDEDRDLFYLPDTGKLRNSDDEDSASDSDTHSDDGVQFASAKVNIHSDDFEELPAETRYEILQDIKASQRKIRNHHNLPDDANSFSNLQLQRLQSRRKIQEKIEKAEKDICTNYTGELADGSSIQAFRVQSDATARILYRNNSYDPKALDRLKEEEGEEEKKKKSQKQESPVKQEQRELEKELGVKDEPSIIDVSSDASLDSIVQAHQQSVEFLASLPPRSHEDSERLHLSPEDLIAEQDGDFYTPAATQVDEATQARSVSDERSIIDSSLAASHATAKRDLDESVLWIDQSEEEVVKETADVSDGSESPTPAEASQASSPPREGIAKDDSVDPGPLDLVDLTADQTHESREERASTVQEDTIESSSSDSSHDFFAIPIPDIPVTDSPKQHRDPPGHVPKSPFSEPSVEDEPPQASGPDGATNKTLESPTESSTSGVEAHDNAGRQHDDRASSISGSQQATPLATPSTQVYIDAPIPETRATNRVTNKVIQDAKELLRLFGIPYLDAAGEAEAQCAKLEELKLTEGTITDDSDIWLFGSQNVLRYFFSDDKYVMQYKMTDIEFHVRLTRDNLACFAMLVGSDYTDGIMNVGPVTALEILSEFPGEGMEPLVKFRDWHREALKDPKAIGDKKRKKLLKFRLPEEFPSRAVFEGYMRPVADTSAEKFSWGTPELDELRDYAHRNFGWDPKKADEKLLPVMKRLNEKKLQRTIDTFFFKTQANRDPEMFRSKRVNQALNKIAKRRGRADKTPAPPPPPPDVVNLSEEDSD